MIKCIIIDDEDHAVNLLKLYIDKTSFLSLEFATTDPLEGLNYINSNEIDLIFLDIQMPHLSGIELSKMVNQKNKVIVTTAFSDFAIDAFNEGVLDYLLKPFSYERFLKATQRVLSIRTNEEPKEIFITLENKGKMQKIFLADIYYIEGLKNYVKFHTVSIKHPIVALLTFKELENYLPKSFIRIHKSFIVSQKSIMGLDGNDVIIEIGEKNMKIPIGPTFKPNLLNIIKAKSIR